MHRHLNSLHHFHRRCHPHRHLVDHSRQLRDQAAANPMVPRRFRVKGNLGLFSPLNRILGSRHQNRQQKSSAALSSARPRI